MVLGKEHASCNVVIKIELCNRQKAALNKDSNRSKGRMSKSVIEKKTEIVNDTFVNIYSVRRVETRKEGVHAVERKKL